MLFAKLKLANERPINLCNALVAEMIEGRVELPAASTLVRLIVKTRLPYSKILELSSAGKLAWATFRAALLTIRGGSSSTMSGYDGSV